MRLRGLDVLKSRALFVFLFSYLYNLVNLALLESLCRTQTLGKSESFWFMREPFEKISLLIISYYFIHCVVSAGSLEQIQRRRTVDTFYRYLEERYYQTWSLKASMHPIL